MTGLAQYIRWDAAPAAVNPLTSFGLGTTGGSFTDTTEPGERSYVGGGAARFGTSLEFTGTVDWDVTTLDPVVLASRAATGYPLSALPEFSIGYADLRSNILHRFWHCKADEITLSAEVDVVLSASMSWRARAKAEVTPGTPTAPTGLGWSFWQAEVRAAGQAIQVQSFRATRANGLQASTDLDGGQAADTRRQYKRLVEGFDRVSVEVTARRALTAAQRGMLLDSIATNLTFSAIFTRGTSVLTLAISNLSSTSAEWPVTADEGEADLSYGFSAPANSNAWSLTLTG